MQVVLSFTLLIVTLRAASDPMFISPQYQDDGGGGDDSSVDDGGDYDGGGGGLFAVGDRVVLLCDWNIPAYSDDEPGVTFETGHEGYVRGPIEDDGTVEVHFDGHDEYYYPIPITEMYVSLDDLDDEEAATLAGAMEPETAEDDPIADEGAEPEVEDEETEDLDLEYHPPPNSNAQLYAAAAQQLQSVALGAVASGFQAVLPTIVTTFGNMKTSIIEANALTHETFVNTEFKQLKDKVAKDNTDIRDLLEKDFVKKDVFQAYIRKQGRSNKKVNQKINDIMDSLTAEIATNEQMHTRELILDRLMTVLSLKLGMRKSPEAMYDYMKRLMDQFPDRDQDGGGGDGGGGLGQRQAIKLDL